ncbi:MAG: hypothetical protein K0U93_07720 [Gammaproteobacteria bacterium]|nr:hypothetical protein [Gammaproteobacteria bacterium]
MNREKLRLAQANFLQQYPKGFADPAMQSIRKKHNVDRLVEFAQQNLTKAHFNQPEFICDTLWKIISRSSMVSRFEKPPFKNFLGALSSHEKKDFAYAMEQRLFGRKQMGFELILGMLSPHKIAKWAVITAVPFYVAPRREVFVKPTTAKGILKFLEVDKPQYHATPSWTFYRGYQQLLAEIRREVPSNLSPNNAALSGFLMMSV